MQEQSFVLYAQWGPDRRSWMIVDDTDLHPLVQAESLDELIAALKHRRNAGQSRPTS